MEEIMLSHCIPESTHHNALHIESRLCICICMCVSVRMRECMHVSACIIFYS